MKNKVIFSSKKEVAIVIDDIETTFQERGWGGHPWGNLAVSALFLKQYQTCTCVRHNHSWSAFLTSTFVSCEYNNQE